MKFGYLVALIAVALACQSPKPQDEAITTPPPGKSVGPTAVQVQAAEAKPFALQLLSNGKLHAPQQSKVQFRASGYIRQVFVRNGQAVAAGAILAQLDDRPARLVLEQAQDALRQAQVEANDRLISLRGKADDSLSVAPNIWAYIKTASGLNQALIAIQKAQLAISALVAAPYRLRSLPQKSVVP